MLSLGAAHKVKIGEYVEATMDIVQRQLQWSMEMGDCAG